MNVFRSLPIFLTNFLFSLHYATTLYINSSFLSIYFSPLWVSILFVLGALGNIYIFLNASRILEVLESKGFLTLFLVSSFGSILGLAFTESALTAGVLFFIYTSTSLMVYYSLDLMLEEFSVDRKTGEIRGLYLTITNLAILGGPFLVALIGSGNQFSNIYISAALLLLPIFLLLTVSLKVSSENEPYLHIPPSFSLWKELSDVRRVTLTRLSLEFFFAVMVIFTPVYLNSTLGFNWHEIGIMFTIMLLPFILFQLPAGELADRRWGEKELMTFGLLFIALSSVIMPLLGKSFALWSLALFLSRVGASLLEVMTDSYFFKKVGVHNTGLISIFRLMRPLGLILGALVVGVSIALLPHKTIFYILAISAFLGLTQAHKLIDTK